MSNVTNCETEPDTLLKIEFDTFNGKPYFGQVSDDELIYVWEQVFGRKKEELFGVTSTKTLTRKVRATFKLKVATKTTDITPSETFAYEKVLDDGSKEEVKGHVLGFNVQKPAQLGEVTRVTVRTNLGVEANGVLNWLRLYGTLTSHNHDFSTNPSTGVKTGNFVAEVVLRRHIEEFLPMYGQKAQVSYPGIPRMCNRCYKVGHLRRDCNNIKKDWVQYIVELLDSGLKKELIGSWKNAVTRWRNANQNAATTN